MGILISAELRKINGLRFARFKLAHDVDIDSKEEALIASAMRECNIESGNNVGVFKNLAQAADGSSVSRIGGVDIPVDAIKDFTTALTRKGFEVT